MLKAAVAAEFFFGWPGHAFRREKFGRRSTRPEPAASLIAIAQSALEPLADRIVLGLMLFLGQAWAVAVSRLLSLLLLALLSMLPPARNRCCLINLANHDALLSSWESQRFSFRLVPRP